ncbi:MAG: preprotein translocase subunit SecG [Candidatus Woesebacteria bacterium]
MKQAITIIQIITSVILIVVILIQSKGTGFGRAWGSTASFTRRGLEKVIFRFTFVLAAIFIVVSILQLTY